MLTRYGQSLCAIAEQHLKKMSLAIESIDRQFQEGKNLELRIACRPEVFRHLSFRIQFAGKIVFHPLSAAESERALRDHKVDVAISYERPGIPGVVAKRIFTSSPRFIIHKKLLPKPLTEKLLQNEEFVRQTPCVMYHEDALDFHVLVSYAKIQTTDLNVRWVTEDWGAVTDLVSQAKGFSVLPAHIPINDPSIASLNLEGPTVRRFDYSILYPKDLVKIPAFRQAIDSLANSSK